MIIPRPGKPVGLNLVLKKSTDERRPLRVKKSLMHNRSKKLNLEIASRAP